MSKQHDPNDDSVPAPQPARRRQERKRLGPSLRPLIAPVDPMAQRKGVPVRDAAGRWRFVSPGSPAIPAQPSRPVVDAIVRRRAELGIPSQTAEDAARGATWLRDRGMRMGETLEEILARGVRFAVPPIDPAAEDEADRIRAARLEAGISDAWMACPGGCPWSDAPRRCVHCGQRREPIAWSVLGTLIKKGRRSLGEVKAEDGRWITGPEAVAEVRRRMATEEQTVLCGENRSGKTLTAAAWADAEIVSGAERVRWAREASLSEPGALDRAEGAKTLIVDDVGEVMGTAACDAFTASQRSHPFAALVGSLSNLSGKRLVVTTYLDPAQMAGLYGGGVSSRVYEHAHVVHFRCREEL